MHSRALAQPTYNSYVSKRHPSVTKRGSRAEAALSDLCIRWGYCIPPDAADALLENPPADAEAFADIVLVADGRELLLVPKDERREIVELIDDWVYAERGRGSISELPVFPAA